MYKQIVIFTLCVLFQNYCHSQRNLIRNGSFEELNSCPQGNTNTSTIEFAVGWQCPIDSSISQYYGSPDLFNRCASGYFGVPLNWYGFQEPSDGNGYAGIIIYQLSNSAREFIQYELDQKLIVGKKYMLQFYFSFGSRGSYKCNNISFALTENKIMIPTLAAIQSGTYFPGLSDSNIVEFNDLFQADTLNWLRFSKEFIAISPAMYITIGNLKNNSETQIEFGWYYNDVVLHSRSLALLDNISLICLDTENCDSTTGISLIQKGNILIYPNPTKEYVNIKSSEPLASAHVEIFDYLGKCIMNQSINSGNLQTTISLSGISGGLYFVRIADSSGVILRKEKLIVN